MKNTLSWPKVNWSWSYIYKISVLEVLVLFTLVFFTYTMPLSVHKFSRSFVGKLLILLSIGLVAHYKIIYGIVLAVLFIVIAEIGYLESFLGQDRMEGKKTTIKKETDAHVAFRKAHCGAKRVNFDLETIQQDYTDLQFSNGVCDPCDSACQFSIKYF